MLNCWNTGTRAGKPVFILAFLSSILTKYIDCRRKYRRYQWTEEKNKQLKGTLEEQKVNSENIKAEEKPKKNKEE